ncbi:hypothetical protein [Jatrophihabitans sp.]|uniref:hypothetical protein n=1 Tax=Jatrophihabitans sp. TaxID=1932789 RepID=UPI002B75B574|nr:hypothetical protein [Jatrophihabitans sp.]
MTLQTSYPFVLPRGYVDAAGTVHKEGRMRLATARDELEPLRDPTVTGPDDPRLTVLVLARVVEKLGTVELVSTHEIEGLFAIDLAFLQDFYGVINFGNQEEYEQLLRAQAEGPPLLGQSRPAAVPAPAPVPVPVEVAPEPAYAAAGHANGFGGFGDPDGFDGFGGPVEQPVSRRGAIEEIPRGR